MNHFILIYDGRICYENNKASANNFGMKSAVGAKDYGAAVV